MKLLVFCLHILRTHTWPQLQCRLTTLRGASADLISLMRCTKCPLAAPLITSSQALLIVHLSNLNGWVTFIGGLGFVLRLFDHKRRRFRGYLIEETTEQWLKLVGMELWCSLKEDIWTSLGTNNYFVPSAIVYLQNISKTRHRTTHFWPVTGA